MTQVPARDLSLTPTPQRNHKGESVRPGGVGQTFPEAWESVSEGSLEEVVFAPKEKSVLLSDQSCPLQPGLPLRTRTEDLL